MNTFRNLQGNDYKQIQRFSCFISEDNASLAKLMEKDREAWKQKFWWIGKAEEEAKQKQLALEADASQGKLNNMVLKTTKIWLSVSLDSRNEGKPTADHGLRRTEQFYVYAKVI